MEEREAAIYLFDIIRHKNADYYVRNKKNNPDLIALMETLVKDYNIKHEETFLAKLKIH
jgi:hypothetical protein